MGDCVGGGQIMRRSISNPRILVPCVLGTLMFLLIVEAYLEYPHVSAGFGAVAGTANIRASEIDNNAQSAELRDQFEKRLQSPQFMKRLVASDYGCRAILEGTSAVVVRFDTKPGASAAEMPEVSQFADSLKAPKLTFLTMGTWNADLSVVFMIVRGYGISQPSSSWIGWLQERLPGMPDRDRLMKEAEAANQVVKQAIERQIQEAARETAIAETQKR
jgi:hypothetical protein